MSGLGGEAATQSADDVRPLPPLPEQGKIGAGPPESLTSVACSAEVSAVQPDRERTEKRSLDPDPEDGPVRSLEVTADLDPGALRLEGNRRGREHSSREHERSHGAARTGWPVRRLTRYSGPGRQWVQRLTLTVDSVTSRGTSRV